MNEWFERVTTHYQSNPALPVDPIWDPSQPLTALETKGGRFKVCPAAYINKANRFMLVFPAHGPAHLPGESTGHCSLPGGHFPLVGPKMHSGRHRWPLVYDPKARVGNAGPPYHEPMGKCQQRSLGHSHAGGRVQDEGRAGETHTALVLEQRPAFNTICRKRVGNHNHRKKRKESKQCK